MIETMLSLNGYLALGVLIFEIAVLGKLFSLIIMSLGDDNNFKKNFKETVYGTKQKIFNSFGLDVLSEKFLLVFVFLFSLFSSILTLVYSEIFQQVPCALCWFERIFMYGIVVLSGISLFRSSSSKGREESLVEQKMQMKNIFVFSIFGAAISLYHHILQMTAGLESHLPCPTSGGDCAKRVIFEYGHITFPWMAFVMFAFFIIIILLQRRLK